MAERYVAFLDVLGFKGQVAHNSQEESEEMIVEFARTVHDVWDSFTRSDKQDTIKAMLASDSVIVYTLEQSREELELLLNFSLALMKDSFERNTLLLRGAIAKGGFMEIRNPGSRNFKEELMVGQAYIDAYTLEGQYKSSTIQMHSNVRDDMMSMFGLRKYPTDLVDKDREIYSLRWADMDYITTPANLLKFVQMATESDWRPHYFNTLYSFMRKETDVKRRNDLFHNILLLLANGDPVLHHRRQDQFIKNSFDAKVDSNYQTMFMEYLRSK